MTHKDKVVLLVEEELVEKADTSHLKYDVQDVATEIELLKGVGFTTMLEKEHYHLFKRENLHALVVENIVIQGSIESVFNDFSLLENISTMYPELYRHLLDMVRVEGV